MNLPAQHTSWERIRDAASAVDRLGYHSVWTWDHFVPLSGDADGPIFEAWQLLAAWGALTKSVRVGTLVTGNTYRHPAVLANMVATLDHVTNGRAILGLGAAWHEGEHRMYGIPFYDVKGRLERMDEAAAIVTRLFDLPFTDHNGRHYRLRNATCEPKPVQKRLPLLIGGAGEQRTLRTVAKFADLWHTNGGPDVFAQKIEVLRRHCEREKRPFEEIVPIATERPWVCLRDREEDVWAWAREVQKANRMDKMPELTPVTSSDALVERLLEFWKVGVRGFIFYTLAPYDLETLERIAREVRPKFEQAVA
ncbi:MAG TPA: TIGR03560 family F420-dependent LLM class oxidoreductase [Candidatus Limnocylindria bacterium]|nr:TIGR03560 family F420-dependent LLM class oxidoreductase [Candidatus Limnocylindria bacterium]